ncbi:MAG: hypothetical protein ACTSU5_05520 [Promethearchaeota archaeon]
MSQEFRAYKLVGVPLLLPVPEHPREPHPGLHPVVRLEVLQEHHRPVVHPDQRALKTQFLSAPVLWGS